MNDYTCLTKQGLDLTIAVFLAEACLEAYSETFSFTKQWIEDRKFKDHETFDAGNTQGFWAVADDVVMLCFRGTSNPGQWIRDARILPAMHPWGLVHRGFKTGVKVVAEHISDFAKLARTKKHVWITGHSLGGALAVMTAANLKNEGIVANARFR